MEIEQLKRFADKGAEFFHSILWAFHQQELDDIATEYVKIAMMALANDAYNQGYSEGNQKGYEDAETIKDIF
jgi:hypothetical protein